MRAMKRNRCNSSGTPSFHTISLKTFTLFALLVIITPLFSAQSQDSLYTFVGENAGDRLGWSVATLGDLNNDGVPDFGIGASKANTVNGDGSGQALIISGASGDVLYTVIGDNAGDYFGGSIASAGDVNGDGTPDIVVGGMTGANPDGIPTGMAKIVSGIDGSLIHNLYGIENDGRFGISVDGAGDVDQDGYDDVVVGAKWENFPGWSDRARGSAKIFSGLTGNVLFEYYGSPHWKQIGYSVAGVGDVNDDGIPDAAIGGRGGEVFLMSGADGTIFHTISDSGTGTLLGVSVSGAGDTNGDGIPDIVMGAPNTSSEVGVIGAAVIYSGADYSILHTFYGDDDGDQFGHAVSGAGDVDGEGYGDVIVGAYSDDDNGDESGSAKVFSGFTGELLFIVRGQNAGDRLGYSPSVSGAGDISGDGLADVIVGAYASDANGEDSGSAFVVVNECLNDQTKGLAGQCGCGIPDTDTDGDGIADCLDICDNNPLKIVPGACGCGVADTDTDGDGTADCKDSCSADANKILPGLCGCGVPDTDADGDGVFDCFTDPDSSLPQIETPTTKADAITLISNTQSILSVFHEKAPKSKKVMKENVDDMRQALRTYFRQAPLQKRLRKRTARVLRGLTKLGKRKYNKRITQRVERRLKHWMHALEKQKQNK